MTTEEALDRAKSARDMADIQRAFAGNSKSGAATTARILAYHLDRAAEAIEVLCEECRL